MDFLRVWLPDDRVFEEAARVVLLLDDAGGEDVRVAMLVNVHKCHTSPRAHTPVRAAESSAGGRTASRTGHPVGAGEDETQVTAGPGPWSLVRLTAVFLRSNRPTNDRSHRCA